jgi:hypothetical protein
MHPIAHHAGEQILAPLLLGSGGVPLLAAIVRARLRLAARRLPAARVLLRQQVVDGAEQRRGDERLGQVGGAEPPAAPRTLFAGGEAK